MFKRKIFTTCKCSEVVSTLVLFGIMGVDEIILLKLLDRIQAVSKNEILRMPNLKGRQRKISPKREWKKLNKRDRKGPKKVKCK